MSNTIEVRKKEDILISLDNISQEPTWELNAGDLPEDDEEKTKKMNERLTKLVNDKWSQDKIRLIAWSEKRKIWYMLKKA